MTRVIVNADDFGLGTPVDEAIVSCIRQGCVSSATILANGDSWQDACRLAKELPQAGFGVHLNATQFRPLTRHPGLARFLDEEGCFRSDFRTRVQRSDGGAIEEEWCAQIQRVLDAGVRVDHLDSHHHSHTAPAVFWALKRVCRKMDIDRVRLTRNLFVVRSEQPFKRMAKWLWNTALRHAGPPIKTTDLFGSVGGLVSVANLVAAPLYPGKTLELMCHPGHESSEYVAEIEALHNGLLRTALGGHELMTFGNL